MSPVLNDDKGKRAQGAEAIVVEESHEIYAWVLSEMARLAPRFRLDKIRIIFADMGIEPTVSLPYFPSMRIVFLGATTGIS